MNLPDSKDLRILIRAYPLHGYTRLCTKQPFRVSVAAVAAAPRYASCSPINIYLVIGVCVSERLGVLGGRISVLRLSNSTEPCLVIYKTKAAEFLQPLLE